VASTIFERCGGFATVRRVVSSFYDKVLESPALSRYFERVDMRALIDHQAKFVSYVMGGPASYTDHQIERVHCRLGITRGEFDEAVGLLCEALEEHGIEPADVAAVGAELRRREPLIVSRDG
jgi:hemoglobin